MSSLAGQALALLWGICYFSCRACLYVPCILWTLFARAAWQASRSSPGATFWEGEVYHIRRRPVKNEFRYQVRVAFVELDGPPKWFHAQASDRLTADAARALAGTTGTVSLLTNPASAGYAQNPISVYYCYARSGELVRCIAEVTNTPWGERVTFAFDPSGVRVPKALHVSPLMDMQNEWLLEASDPKLGALKLVVNADHPQLGRYFDAVLTARLSSHPHERNEEASWDIIRKYAFQPHRIAVWIYLQAVLLLWKGVAFYGPPDKTYQTRISSCSFSRLTPMTEGTFFRWRGAQSWPWL